MQHDWSRRQFVASLTGMSALLVMDPLFGWAGNELDPRVAAIVANTLGVDTHNHIDVPNKAAELPGPAIDLAGELRKSGLSAICMTFAVDYQPLINPGDAYERFTNTLTAMDKALADNRLKRSMTLTDLQAAHKKGQPAIIQAVEGCHFLAGKLERLQGAYDRGLRQLGLLHDNDASVPLGDIYTKTPQWGGLTAFGADVIRECNRLGILVDLTHASNDTINATLKVTTRPVVSSHTGLDTQLGSNATMATMMRPRLISKEQAKIMADADGLIGVWTHLADTPLAYAQNIRAMVDVVGIDHVCLGTDTKLTPAYRSPDAGPRLEGPRPQGSPPGGTGTQPGNGAGNRPAGPPVSANEQGVSGGARRERVGERTNRAWADQTTGFYYIVVDALLKTGFDENDIAKIGGRNFCRVFDAATKGRS